MVIVEGNTTNVVPSTEFKSGDKVKLKFTSNIDGYVYWLAKGTTGSYAMIIVQVKEGENIEKALKKFKRKFEKTGVVKELRSRQAFEKPSVRNRKKMMKAVYVQHLRATEE